jgi:hypothetical protein
MKKIHHIVDGIALLSCQCLPAELLHYLLLNRSKLNTAITTKERNYHMENARKSDKNKNTGDLVARLLTNH